MNIEETQESSITADKLFFLDIFFIFFLAKLFFFFFKLLGGRPRDGESGEGGSGYNSLGIDWSLIEANKKLNHIQSPKAAISINSNVDKCFSHF